MPTAFELPRDRWRLYLEAARRRSGPQRDAPAEGRERDRLLAQMGQVAELLKTRLGVRRVIPFGSLAHAVWFTPATDIDLAAEGLRHEVYWQAWRVVEEAFPDRQVDLITLETASESLRRAIARHGVEL